MELGRDAAVLHERVAVEQQLLQLRQLQHGEQIGLVLDPIVRHLVRLRVRVRVRVRVRIRVRVRVRVRVRLRLRLRLRLTLTHPNPGAPPRGSASLGSRARPPWRGAPG